MAVSGAHPASQDRAATPAGPSPETVSGVAGIPLREGFTPGPWQAFRDRHNESYVIDTALGRASTNVTVIADDIRGEQRHANARLIAAAPELYEALDDLADAVGNFNRRVPATNESLARALAVLAKVRGQ